MTSNPALDAAIRKARHVMFSLDGPIRSTVTGKPVDLATPTAPHIHDVVTVCRESGRTVSVISAESSTDVTTYLDARDLLTHFIVIAASVGDALSTLAAAPDTCLFVTSSSSEIRAAASSGVPSIGFARAPKESTPLISAGAISFIYSMTEITIGLRSQVTREGRDTAP